MSEEEKKLEERKKMNAPFIRAFEWFANRATEFSGSLFSTSGTFTITLNDECDTPWTGTW